MIKFASLLAAGFFLLTTASAQTPNHVTQPAEWYSLNVAINLSRKIALVNDGNFRFVDKMQAQQDQLRTGLEYSLSKNLSIVPIGYSYIWNPRYGKQPAAFVNNEFRFWQQIQYKQKTGKLSIGHRFRIEERWIQRHHYADDGEVINDRFANRQTRLRFRENLVLPLGDPSAKPSYFYLNVWDEVFYSWGKYVKYRTPSQNRLFAGVGYQISKSSSIQGGFLYQWLKKDSGIQTENNIGMLIQYNRAFDWTKRKPK